MHDMKVIKKIFRLTQYDFMNNLHSWLSLTGLQAVAYILIFACMYTMVGDFQMSYWAWIENLFFDWKDILHELFYCNPLDYFYNLKLLGLHLLLAQFLLFPVILIQNALDLAFDSTMRGISIRSIPVTYIIGLNLGLVLLFSLYGCFDRFLYFVIMYGFLFLLDHKVLIYMFFNDFSIYLGFGFYSFLYLYIFQLLYLFVMHLLEYKKSLFISFKECNKMIVGKKYFLMQVLLIQIFVTVTSLAFFYYVLGFIIKIIMPCFVWMFALLSISLPQTFMYMIYNFFYLWAYLLLFAWILLVTAHLYRQLVCPAIENAVCSSCTSCEK